MTAHPGQALLRALAALQASLEELSAPAMLIGGMAVIVRGVARVTRDVDATVWGPGLDVARALAILQSHGLRPRIVDALDFALQSQVLLLEQADTATPVDLSIAWLPFEDEALRAATLEDLGGVRMRVARAEDLIVLKAVAWRERDRTDIERLLTLHGARMDLARVRRWVREFAVCLEDTARVDAFEEILRQACGEG